MRRRPAPQLLLAFATLVATAAPVVAAGLPACCKPAASAIKAGCCAAKNAPCCKTPEAPKPDAAAKHAAPSLTVAPPPAFATPLAVLAATVPALTSVRTAQRENRAPTPDDSPPDRLARLRVLLI